MDKPIPPWERPKIAFILSLFSGSKISSIITNDKINIKVGGNNDEVQR